MEYPAAGSPQLAMETQQLISSTEVSLTESWGLDHGAWSVIKHLYPGADVPVIELSLDYTQSGQYHYDLAKQLASLRKNGVLIIGSGNMVHNLRLIAWDKMNSNYAFDWATEANERMKAYILSDNHTDLIKFSSQGRSFELAIPTPEHYLPMLYVLALKNEKDTIRLFNDKPIGGSLSMTSLLLDAVNE